MSDAYWVIYTSKLYKTKRKEKLNTLAPIWTMHLDLWCQH